MKPDFSEYMYKAWLESERSAKVGTVVVKVKSACVLLVVCLLLCHTFTFYVDINAAGSAQELVRVEATVDSASTKTLITADLAQRLELAIVSSSVLTALDGNTISSSRGALSAFS